ncbi:MAG: ABC transporter permease [Calditrichaeota bacterium]|nr:ABC transporter permease [Calditrichota bacterium]
MFQNYLKITFRNMLKHKGYSLINIAGLAIGMACCVLILLYVQHELSYDRYHKQAENIYRLERDIFFQGHRSMIPVTAHPYGPALESDFPEVAAAIRIWPSDTDYLDQNQQYNRGNFIYADADVLNVFDWKMRLGDRSTCLEAPFTIVITEALAARYFPEGDPLGKVLTMQWGKDYDFKVTGVIEDIPDNSHFKFDAIASYATLYSIRDEETMSTWFSNNIFTYVLLKEGASPNALTAKLPAWMEKYMGNTARDLMGPEVDITDIITLKLKPLTDIHLYSQLEHEIEPNGDITMVYVLSGIALLILLIACINFMNLATARSMSRAKEVGLRKVVGAPRSRLILQFLGESVVMALIALLLAVILIEALLPTFNYLTGKALAIPYRENPLAVLGFIAIALVVGIFAGSYPAFFLSGFQPITVLKGHLRSHPRGGLLRKVLVVTQFAISIALIICTIGVMNQLHYLRAKKLGFDKEHVVVIEINDATLRYPRSEALLQSLAQSPAVLSVAAADEVPGNRRYSDTMFHKDNSGVALEDMINLMYYQVSHDYIPTLGMEMAAGRNFSHDFPADTLGGYIINEAAVREIGWASPEDAVGRDFGKVTEINPLTFGEGKIIGVVKDFHFKSLRQEIEPLVLELNPRAKRNIFVRIRPENIPATLAFLEQKTEEFSPTYPFTYFFQDEYFDSLYRSEDRLQEIFGYFTFLAIFIACLGLFGLASFTAEQRTREIGVRKVLGAGLGSIAGLLSREFLKWVLLANLIAWPVAWYLMRGWLENFAYRTELGWLPFVLAGAAALLIALLTVSYQAVKAGLVDPVKALRYE